MNLFSIFERVCVTCLLAVIVATTIAVIKFLLF